MGPAKKRPPGGTGQRSRVIFLAAPWSFTGRSTFSSPATAPPPRGSLRKPRGAAGGGSAEVPRLPYAAVSVVLLAAAAAASYIPAHRASSINPVEALRAE